MSEEGADYDDAGEDDAVLEDDAADIGEAGEAGEAGADSEGDVSEKNELEQGSESEQESEEEVESEEEDKECYQKFIPEKKKRKQRGKVDDTVDEDEVQLKNILLPKEMKASIFGDLTVVKKEDRITKDKLYHYEFTRILGARAAQLNKGAKPLIALDQTHEHKIIDIAKEEILANATPFCIGRELPGKKLEVWELHELKKPAIIES